jgi:arylsulfatase A-like enzyme
MKRTIRTITTIGMLSAVGLAFVSPYEDVYAATSASAGRERPNILFILVDDMGYSDLGCFGGEINTPMRNWKHYSHEGGINTPFIVSWPAKIKQVGGYNREPMHVVDIMSTLVDLTGATYPAERNGKPIFPMQGTSILPTFEGKPLTRETPIFFQWAKGGAVRDGNWKAVFWGEKWKLFDFSKDRNESSDLSSHYPEKLQSMKAMHADWYQKSKQPPPGGRNFHNK